MTCLWNFLSMKCPVYEMSCLWNVQSMKYPNYGMCCLWNFLSMNCPAYEMFYEISCLWNVLHLWNILTIECPVCEMSGLENVYQYISVQLNRNRLFILICPPYYRILICPPYYRILKIGKYLGENCAYCLVSYFQVFSCSIQPFSPFSLALTVCADFSSVLIHHQVLK